MPAGNADGGLSVPVSGACQGHRADGLRAGSSTASRANRDAAALPRCAFPLHGCPQYSSGRWEALPVEETLEQHRLYRPYRDKFHGGLTACSAAQASRPAYRWAPQRCSLLPFDREALCARLGGADLLFVGDSTVLQLFQAFVIQANGQFGFQGHGADVTALACGGMPAWFRRVQPRCTCSHPGPLASCEQPHSAAASCARIQARCGSTLSETTCWHSQAAPPTSATSTGRCAS